MDSDFRFSPQNQSEPSWLTCRGMSCCIHQNSSTSRRRGGWVTLGSRPSDAPGQDVKMLGRSAETAAETSPDFLFGTSPAAIKTLKNPGLSLSPSACQVQYNQNKGNLNLYIYVPVTTSTISISLYDHHDWPLGILCWLRELSTWFSCDLA